MELSFHSEFTAEKNKKRRRRVTIAQVQIGDDIYVGQTVQSKDDKDCKVTGQVEALKDAVAKIPREEYELRKAIWERYRNWSRKASEKFSS